MLKPVIWIISDPKPGTLAQAVGLADRLGGADRVIEARPRFPWRFLPARCWLLARYALQEPLTGPLPELVIAAGRSAVAPAAALRSARCRVVALLDPRMDPARFDLVIAPRHDRLQGASVLSTLGGLHRLTPERIADAARLAAPRYAGLPRPLLAVMLGGPTRHLTFSEADAAALGAQLALTARQQGAALAVTASRRTPPEAVAAFRRALTDIPHDFYDPRHPDGENPYPGLLGLADHVLVTEDSTSMISEATMSGRPLHLLPLSGKAGKFALFADDLMAGGYARRFDGTLPVWQPPPLDETGRAARAVVGLLIDPPKSHIPA
jgi:mitochondrial fission protein ELM1